MNNLFTQVWQQLYCIAYICAVNYVYAYVQEGGNEGGRGATPTSISIFDSYDMKTLWFIFDHDIFSSFKMPRL